MAATYKSAAQADGGTSTTTAFSLTLPSGLSDGDVGYLVIALNTQNDRGDPSGWTQLDFTVSGTVLQQKVYRKVLTAAESSTAVAFTLSNAQKWAAAVVVVSGDDGVDSDTEVWSTGSAGTAWTAGEVTPTVDDVLLVCMHSARRAASGTFSETSPTGWTERADISTNAAASPSIGIGAHTQAVSGGSGVGTGADTDGAVSASCSNQISFVLAVKPALESHSGTITATGAGSSSTTGQKDGAGTCTASGSSSSSTTGGKTGAGTCTATGSGTSATTGQKEATGTITASGSASCVVDGGNLAGESHSGTITATASSSCTLTYTTTRAGTCTATSSSSCTVTGGNLATAVYPPAVSSRPGTPGGVRPRPAAGPGVRPAVPTAARVHSR